MLTLLTAFVRQLLRMSLAAMPVLLVLFLVRQLLRRAPKRFSYALWGIAAFRLLCPAELAASVFSIFNLSGVSESVAAAQSAADTAFSGNVAAMSAVSGAQSGAAVGAASQTTAIQTVSSQSALTGAELLALVWLAGVIALLALLVVQAIRLQRRTRRAVRLEKGVWLAEEVPGPFVWGLVRPRIYLPCGLNEAEQGYVLAHERAHIRRGDLWWKALGTAVLALHWWNPLVWLAYRAFTRDMELSCDEAVLRQLGEGNEQDYSRTLLALAANRKDFGPALAFGKPAVKARIQNALRFRKAGRSVLAVSLALLLIAGLCCCTGALTGDASAESGLREKAERLCALQVSYIGDNSAVSALVGEVVGQSYQLTLQTTEIPYGLVVELTGSAELSEGTAFLWGAELLALIDNADYCSFQYGEDRDVYTVEKEKVEDVLGLNELRDASRNADTMYDLLTKLNEASDEDISGVYATAHTNIDRNKAERLCALRVSDITKCSDTIALVNVVTGDSIAYQELSFEIDEEPYGLLLTLSSTETLDESSAFSLCAQLLALIGNADYCRVQSGANGKIYTVERSAAEAALGVDDLWSASESADALLEFLTQLEELTGTYDIALSEDGNVTLGMAQLTTDHFTAVFPSSFRQAETEDEKRSSDAELNLVYQDGAGTVSVSYIPDYEEAMDTREKWLTEHPESAANADQYETQTLPLTNGYGKEFRYVTDNATFLGGYLLWQDGSALWVDGYCEEGSWDGFEEALLTLVQCSQVRTDEEYVTAAMEESYRTKAGQLRALQISDLSDSSAVYDLVNEVVNQPYLLTLQTDAEPYGLLVELTDSGGIDEDTVFSWGAQLLALIDNAEYCSFQVSSETAQYRLERTAAETALGMDDLRDACQSTDDMTSFLTKLDGTAGAGDVVTCTDAGSNETVYATFDDLMGYSGEIVLYVSADSFKTLYYYGATENGGTILLGESFGWYTEDEIVDLDGDGVTELVCNVTYGGDGAERCYVYSLGEDGQSVQWSINKDAILDADTIWSVNAITERYTDGVFTLTALPVKDGETLPEETYHPVWPDDFVQNEWP